VKSSPRRATVVVLAVVTTMLLAACGTARDEARTPVTVSPTTLARSSATSTTLIPPAAFASNDPSGGPGSATGGAGGGGSSSGSSGGSRTGSGGGTGSSNGGTAGSGGPAGSGGSGGTVSPPPPAGPVRVPDDPANLSRLPWQSGVYVSGSDPALAQRFAQWRGRPIDVAVFWPNRDTWADLTDAPVYDAWSGVAATWVMGMPMWPEGLGGSTQACATGAYDANWRDIATALKATGHADRTIIRLAWEFNGTWYQWSGFDAPSWISCWRRIVTAAESVAPELRWDWNVNAGWTALTGDASYLWPGDAYVDYVGVDSYDQWPTAVDENTWFYDQYLGDARLKDWLDFAIAHGKKLSVPEWGVSLTNADFGVPRLDNAFYVRKMFEFFAANAEHIAYESYFNESNPAHTGALVDPVQNPAASATYLEHYRP
jgi:hypothetical protein